MKKPDKNKNNEQDFSEKQELNYQKREEIRMANQSSGEATPPDMESADHTHKITGYNNFNNVNMTNEGKSLEDRDTNDGDANNENQ